MEIQLHGTEIREISNRGERWVLEQLSMVRDDPGVADWVVLHSVRIKKHVTKQMGEADLAILMPSINTVLLLEIKGHESLVQERGKLLVQYRDGSRTDPLQQIMGAKSSVLSLLQEARKSRSIHESAKVHVAAGVLLPFASLGSVDGIPWDRSQIADEKELKEKLIQSLMRLALYGGEKLVKSPMHQNTQAFVRDQLQPKFEPMLRPRAPIEMGEQETIRLTEAQREIVDSIFENDHHPHVIQGPAGSGKTLIALDFLNRYAAENPTHKILFLCYNAFLAEKIRSSGQGDFEVSTLHKFMFRILGLKSAPNPMPFNYFDQIVPERAAEAAIEGDIKYDLIVVDEYPDAFSHEVLTFLDILLQGGFEKGRWHFLGDLQQDIFKRDVDERFKEFCEKYCGTRRPYLKYLRANLRNTRQIASLAKKVLGDETIVISRADGEPISSSGYLDLDNAVEKEIKYWLDKGFKRSEILILTPKPSMFDLKFNGSPIEELKSAGAVLDTSYSTARKFKGCESFVVILIDPQDVPADNDEQRRLLAYIALTRAKHGLSILYSKEKRSQFNSLIGCHLN